MDGIMANSKKATHLQSVPARNGRKDKEEAGIGKLFSGKVSGRATKARKQTKKGKPIDSLPEELKELGDVFAAGQKVYRELDFKVRHAEYQVTDYCVRRFCENYLATGHRHPSIEYRGDKSHFTFIQTSRINLTPDKVEALKLMNVAIDDHTELKGIEINSHAIQEHGLEKKLRAALEHLGMSAAVLEECFELVEKSEIFVMDIEDEEAA